MTKKNGKTKRGLTKQQKKEVKEMQSKNDEDKVASSNSALVNHNSGITATDLYRIIPGIRQGVQEGERVGNEITAKKLYIQGLVNLIFDPASSRSKVGVRVMMFSVKGFANGTRAIANSSSWIDAILRDGNNVRPFAGSIRDYFLPHNSDIITMHAEKRFTLTQPFLWNTGLSPPSVTVPIQEQYATKFWKATIKCRNKKLKFTADAAGQPNASVPENYGPLIAVGYVKLDGTAPDVLTTGLQMQTSAQLYYEDS